MWKQKQQTPALQPDPPSTTQSPASNTPDKPPDDSDCPEQVQTHIGESLQIKGRITGNEDVHIVGEFEGTIELPDHALLVGSNGHLRAEANVRSLILWGNLEGKVHVSERTEIHKTGSLTGELETEQIAIEDSGMFRGSIKLLQPQAGEKPDPPPADKPPSEAASADTRPGASPDRSNGEQGEQAG